MPVKKLSPKDRARDLRLRKQFGITLVEYESILRYQMGECAICGRPPLGRNRLAVDHNHKTGLVRGLLCMRCNRALGRFQDDDDRLCNAASYVTSPPAASALGRRHYTAPHRVGTKVRAKALQVLALGRRK